VAKNKKFSKILEKAMKRASGLQSIGNIQLGPNLSLETYRAAIEETQQKLDAYNQTLSASDLALNAFQESERRLRELNQRVLAAVAANYGTDSTEYEAAGGKRRSERKRRSKKSA